MNLTKIEDVPNYGFDKDTGAILSTSADGYQAYVANRKKMMEIDTLKEDVEGLKTSINNINEGIAAILNIITTTKENK